ncbi:MAG: aminotransferase class III-fold pyridoxal phosphate-dependent enzyme, partial [Bacteroidales bacterium]
FNVIPDILILAKGLGAGMPLGAFVSSPEIMSAFKSEPHLGHITTFGGHPVSCAAGLASLKILLDTNIVDTVNTKEKLFRSLLVHPAIKSVRGMGLFLALEMDRNTHVKKIISEAISRGVVLDGFLFCDHAIRITPPLIITEKQITDAVTIIIDSIRESL